MLFRSIISGLVLITLFIGCNKQNEELWLSERAQIRTYLQNKGVSTIEQDASYGYYEDEDAGYFYYKTTLGDSTADSPDARSTVEMYYTAMLFDETVFDSTHSHTPDSLKLSNAIPGLQLALPNFPIGTKARVILPSRLGYGAKGREPAIPGNSILIFDVEIIEIHPHF